MKILIIDDNQPFRDSLKEQLERLDSQLNVLTVDNDADNIRDIFKVHGDIDDLIIDFAIKTKLIHQQNNALGLIDDLLDEGWIQQNKHRISLVTGKKALLDIKIKGNYKVFIKPVNAGNIYHYIMDSNNRDEYYEIKEKYSFLADFPLPLRVINKEHNVVFHNILWDWGSEHPSPQFNHLIEGANPHEFTYFDAEVEEKTNKISGFCLEDGVYFAEICEEVKPIVNSI